MKEFDELLEVANRLLGPQGCPWDLQQNFFTLQPYLLEESHEVVEAIDEGDNKKIFEELGDLLYTIIFYSKLAEKQNLFTIGDVLTTIKEKLIRRHPHIFGEETLKDAQEVLHRWDAIKKGEPGHANRTSGIDGIPERMPTLARAQKMLKKVKKTKFSLAEEESLSEKETGEELIKIILRAEKGHVDCEGALRRALGNLEFEFRQWEKEE